MKWRHNWQKYQIRKNIRKEWMKRLDDAKKNATQYEYARIIIEYILVRNKIRRYYDWSGRMC